MLQGDETVARARVVVCGREVRQLEAGGEGERAETAARARQVGQRDAAGTGARAEQPNQSRGQVGDLAVSPLDVFGVPVEQLLELGADRVREVAAPLAVGVDEERCDGMRELQRRAMLSDRSRLPAGQRGEVLLDRLSFSFGPGSRDVECSVIVGASRERDRPGVHGLDPVSLG